MSTDPQLPPRSRAAACTPCGRTEPTVAALVRHLERDHSPQELLRHALASETVQRKRHRS